MAVQEKVGMPLDEFIRLSNDNPFEIINGERYPRLPTITDHSEIIDKLYMALKVNAELQNLGIVRVEATYVLPERYNSNWVTGSRIPDLLFISAHRLAAYKESQPDWKQKPYLIVPDLVAEVISPTDVFSKVDEKVDVYLADGVRLVILIDPQRRKTIVYSPDAEQPLHLSGDAQIDLNDLITGLKIALASLFE